MRFTNHYDIDTKTDENGWRIFRFNFILTICWLVLEENYTILKNVCVNYYILLSNNCQLVTKRPIRRQIKENDPFN